MEVVNAIVVSCEDVRLSHRSRGHILTKTKSGFLCKCSRIIMFFIFSSQGILVTY
jgi:hypothetical protein